MLNLFIHNFKVVKIRAMPRKNLDFVWLKSTFLPIENIYNPKRILINTRRKIKNENPKKY
jgi:hypothetical protein